MKKLLLIIVAAVFVVVGCGGSSSRDKSFAQYYAELEKEPLQATQPSNTDVFKTPEESHRERELAAQAERRARPPLVESNYIFQVMPDKGTYGFDEYNQVWTDDPKLKDYKAAKRLWNKPKRYQGDSYGDSSGDSSSSGGDEDYSYEDDEDYEY